jgi:hypothetical protein
VDDRFDKNEAPHHPGHYANQGIEDSHPQFFQVIEDGHLHLVREVVERVILSRVKVTGVVKLGGVLLGHGLQV